VDGLQRQEQARLLDAIGRARVERRTRFQWFGAGLRELPEEIGELVWLEDLYLAGNLLTRLPESLGRLDRLRGLDLADNQLSVLPTSIGRLKRLERLSLAGNRLKFVPDELSQLSGLTRLSLANNELTALPESLGCLDGLRELSLARNTLDCLPASLGGLSSLEFLFVSQNRLLGLPDSAVSLASLEVLDASRNLLVSLPETIGGLENLRNLSVGWNGLESLPESIGQLTSLERLHAESNLLTAVPASLGRLPALKQVSLEGNPLNSTLASTYDAGFTPLMTYLRSLEGAPPLHEARLLLVGEGGVGKTTLLKALIGAASARPEESEPTTHGVKIDIAALRLPHPDERGVEIQLNAWDFGGQDVYRVTHQFFFSRRSLYLLVWEPRRGASQCQVEDWLKMIRLRVGDDANVLIVSTRCRSGECIARIDKQVLIAEFGPMIAGFCEVDSLVVDPVTGLPVGIAELRLSIASSAAQLEHMGVPFNSRWKDARDELLGRPEPRISYDEFLRVCEAHGLERTESETLDYLMHDLGYIVHYAQDEKLRDDVVLQPQWLTKAIGLVLEDRTTQQMEGILPDSRLQDVWHDHVFSDEPRYDPSLYPFFLRLMQKYDVCYRLPGQDASLIAQHVPDIRPELPWLLDDEPESGQRSISLVCAMDEVPPGLVPWMIVRTHDYATEMDDSSGLRHRLHWQNGMFLRHPPHGEALLELRDREFLMRARADWPDYFMNVLQHTLDKLINDNWPGLQGRFAFSVPCRTFREGRRCRGRFKIDALRRFMAEGDRDVRCQDCHEKQSISELLLGLEDKQTDQRVLDIEERLDGFESRVAYYFMSLMRAVANEAKDGPRLFTLERIPPSAGRTPHLVSVPMRLHLWCEAESGQHPVMDEGVGVYEFSRPREWVEKILPYARFMLRVLKTVAPLVSPGAKVILGAADNSQWGDSPYVEIADAFVDDLPDPEDLVAAGNDYSEILGLPERSGLLAMHALLRELDPYQARLGLTRVPTYTGEYRWLCASHLEDWEPSIPETT
jgi:internalin A